MNFRIRADLSDNGKAIDLRFPYHAGALTALRSSIPGRRWVEPADGQAGRWRVPRNLQTCILLRETFGDYLVIGPKLKRWARREQRMSQKMRALHVADDAQLERLPEVLPELAEMLYPYQRADVMLMSKADVLNANQPGLGKTIETIAAVFEAGLDRGPQLVLAPKTSLDVVWEEELRSHQEYPLFILTGDLPPAERNDMMRRCQNLAASDLPFWLIMNHQQLWMRDDVGSISWKTIIVDEFHKAGMRSVGTNFEKTLRGLKRERLFLISGTPMGGKAINLWIALHALDPKEFSSKWQWAEQWLQIDDTGFAREIGGIKLGREEEFYLAHAGRMVRRLKSEVLVDLPPKQYKDVWCDMVPKQKQQYEKFAADAEVRIDEEKLSATSVLAEYTRLKQFANALCTVDVTEKTCSRCNGGGVEEAMLTVDGNTAELDCERCAGSGIEKKLKVVPTTTSGKLPYLMEMLDERGLRPGECEGEEKVIVVSQFRGMVDMLCDHFNEQGMPAVKITGGIKQSERTRLVRQFQADGGPRIMCVVTTAGGVAITLDKADSVHIMDETWDPDDQEQVEDRAHRASRMHNVTIYTYRSKETIEQVIMDQGLDKKRVNTDVLDLRRQGLKATTNSKSIRAARKNRSATK